MSEFNQIAINNKPATKGWLKTSAIIGADFLGLYEGCKNGASAGLSVGSYLGHPIEGAVIGGAVMGSICGIGASYAAKKGCELTDNSSLFNDVYSLFIGFYPDIKEVTENQLELVPSANEIDLPETAVQVGAVHNQVLKLLCDDSYKSANKSELIYDDRLTELEIAIITNKEICDGCKTFLENFLKSGSITLNSSIPDKVISMYYDLISETSFDSSDMIKYINTYHSIIENSEELTEQEKESIYMGLSVSLFSYNYWKEYGFFISR